MALAWPIAAGMLGETALGLVDTKLVGGLGAAALGGVGTAWTLLFLGYALVFGLMRAVKVRAAYAVGQGRPEDAVRYAHAGLWIGAGLGVVLWALMRDVGPALVWLGVDASMIPYARAFAAARSWGAVGTCGVAALIQYMQGVEDSRTPMVVGLGGNLLNAVLAWALIYGRLGAPALGVRGAGYATATAEMCELASMLLVVAYRSRRAPRPAIGRRAALREVLSLGVPTGLHFGLEMAAFTTFTTILGSIGAAQMAAHQIALSTIRASFLPGAAVAEAASVLVARSLGGNRLAEADRVARTAVGVAVGFMTGCGVLFALFGASLAAAFAEDAEVVAIARRLLLVAAVFQTLDAANMVLRGALRGAKDVRWVAVAGTTIVWVCVPGTALVLGRLAGWGALGGWIGFVLETTLGATVMWRRWSRGSWREAFGEQARAPDEGAGAALPAVAGG